MLSKVAGLTDEQASRPPVSPSTLTPAWLVQHLTGVEWFWFTIDFAGVALPAGWPMDEEHRPFRLAPGDTLAGLVRATRPSANGPDKWWRQRISTTRRADRA